MKSEPVKSRCSVSIVLPTYNRPRTLKRTIEYLSQQNPPPLEILVIDQSESVPTEMNKYLSQLAITEKVRWIRQQPANAQKARNRGILEAKGSVLIFLDDDIECERGLVAAHWRNYEDFRVAAVSGMILEPGQQPTQRLPQRFYGKKLGWIYFPLNYALRAESVNLSSCNCSIRRKVALAVGGFDENFTRTLFDDSDFSWRLHLYCRARGLRTIHDPEACLTHLRVPTGGRRPDKINPYILADAEAWQTWFYFHLKHLGSEALKVLASRYRWWIWHKKNILKPWWLLIAHLHFVSGLLRTIRRFVHGPKLINNGSDLWSPSA